MKIVIIGAGNLGKLYTGLLTLLGADVTLLGKNTLAGTYQLFRLQQAGLTVFSAPPVWEAWSFPGRGTNPFTVQPKLFANPAKFAQTFDLAIILVKSYNTAYAARQAAQVLKPDGLCLTLQNGLGNAEILGQFFEADRVRAGVTSLGATRYQSAEPDLQTATLWGGLGQTAFGLDHPHLNTLAALLQDLHLPIVQTENIAGLIWSKLLVNSAVNPLTALLDMPNGALLEKPVALAQVDALTTETATIAQAAGISLPFSLDQAVAHVRNVVRINANNISSMLNDVRSKPIRTEIETISGAVVRQAAKLGLAAPLNREMYERVKALEETSPPEIESAEGLPADFLESELYRDWQLSQA